MQASLECAIEYAQKREAFGRSIAKFQSIQVSKHLHQKKVMIKVSYSLANLRAVGVSGPVSLGHVKPGARPCSFSTLIFL